MKINEKQYIQRPVPSKSKPVLSKVISSAISSTESWASFTFFVRRPFRFLVNRGCLVGGAFPSISALTFDL